MWTFFVRFGIVATFAFLGLSVSQAQTGKEVIVLVSSSSVAPGGSAIKAARTSSEVAAISGMKADFMQRLDLDISTNIPPGRRLGLHRNAQSLSHFPVLLLKVNDEELATLRKIPTVRAVMENIGGGKSTLFNASMLSHFNPTAYSIGNAGAGQTIAVIDAGFGGPNNVLSGRISNEACFSTGGWIGGNHYSNACPSGVSPSTGIGSAIKICPWMSDLKCRDHGTMVANTAAGTITFPPDAAPPYVATSGVARNSSVIQVSAISKRDIGGEYQYFLWDVMSALNWLYQVRLSGVNLASINMSFEWGGAYPVPCDSGNESFFNIVQALKSVGVATVAAAGNSGYANSIAFPACVSNVVSVGSITRNDSGFESFSNQSQFMTIVATGQVQYLTVGDGSFFTDQFGGHMAKGTSFSAPQVAGAIAVLKSNHPGASIDQVIYALRTATTKFLQINTGDGPVYVPRLDVKMANDVFPPMPGGSY